MFYNDSQIFPQWIKLQLPLVVTALITYPLLANFPCVSHIPTSLTMLPPWTKRPARILILVSTLGEPTLTQGHIMKVLLSHI